MLAAVASSWGLADVGILVLNAALVLLMVALISQKPRTTQLHECAIY